MTLLVRDSAAFNAHGRRLLEALGVLDPDPLLAAAQEWLAGHAGPETPATRRVRAELEATLPPADVLEAVRRFRGVK